MTKEVRTKVLKGKIQKTEMKGYAGAGVIRKWRREIRNLNK